LSSGIRGGLKRALLFSILKNLTPYLNPDVVFNKKTHKIFRRSYVETMDVKGWTGSIIEMSLEEEGYAFNEVTSMLSPSVRKWCCSMYKFPEFNGAEYFFSHTPGFFKSLFSKFGIDLSSKGFGFSQIVNVVKAFKVFKSTKTQALNLCTNIIKNNGVVLALSAFNRLPFLGPISVFAIPRPPKGKYYLPRRPASYKGVVALNKKLGIDADLSLVSDFEEQGLLCNYVSYKVIRGKVMPYVALEFSHKNEKESFKKTIEYLKSKGLANDSHYSEEGDKGFMHTKVVFSNKKPKLKSYFWIGYSYSYVKPEISIN
tara:strand:+ start:432 stop:1373 length:942 start_codon:yes stop_codon:yes gene_type:complete